VVFEFSRSARAKKLSTTRIEQRYVVRALVASDWQVQGQTPCVTRNLQWRLTSIGGVFSAHCRTATKIEGHNGRGLSRWPISHPHPPCTCKKHHGSRSQPHLYLPPLTCRLYPNFTKFLEARAARAEMLQPRIGFRQGQLVMRDAFENGRTGTPDALRVWKISG